MDLAEYARHDATSLAELVARREVSPQELLATLDARLTRDNPRLNAVIRHDLAEAEAQVATLPDGPFRGVPFLVKELGMLREGRPLGFGTALLQNLPAPHDSELVRRYRRAGLLVAGATNTPELGLCPYTEPVVHGPTRNPWQPELSPGGSSGGSAAAVAAGIVPMASANDGGGSIRIPASHCGLFGFKPSRGLMPMGPDIGQAWHGLVQPHALTRSVRDSAALLDASAGTDCGAPYAAPAGDGFLAATRRPPPRLRVALLRDNPLGGTLHPDCVAAVDDAARLLAGLGHHVEEARPAFDADTFCRAYLHVVAAEARHAIEWICELAGERPALRHFEPATWAMGLLGKNLSAPQFVAAYTQLDQLARRLGRFFEHWDVLLSPTVAQPPLPTGALQPGSMQTAMIRMLSPLGELPFSHNPLFVGMMEEESRKLFAQMPFTPMFNASGQPAISVPLYWNDAGLPVGVQLASAMGRDALLMALAAQLEQARPWFERRPPGFE